MENQVTIESQISKVIDLYNMHNRLYKNVLEGMGNYREVRAGVETNPAAWMAAHLISTRHMIGNMLGIEKQDPYNQQYTHGKKSEAGDTYPTTEELLAEWDAYSPIFMEALNSASAETLNSDAPFGVPTGNTIGDFISFSAHHEAYHIGQIGILRKFHGLEGMKYS